VKRKSIICTSFALMALRTSSAVEQFRNIWLSSRVWQQNAKAILKACSVDLHDKEQTLLVFRYDASVNMRAPPIRCCERSPASGSCGRYFNLRSARA
jgi:hypothetical protein